MTALFLKPVDWYIRRIDPLGQYIEQSAIYLSKMTGDDIGICRAYIRSKIKDKSFPGMRDPTVLYFERNTVGDRHQTQSRLTHYIYSAIKEQWVVVPTFTVYTPKSQTESMLSGFILHNTHRRSVAKKEAFKARAEGDTHRYVIKNNEQANMKLYNNALSGSFVTRGCITHNPTAHSTLTSITRSITSISNASNERLIAGNRHYYNPGVILNNCIAIITATDYETMQRAIEVFNLVYPTTEDVISCITYSSKLYWTDSEQLGHIQAFIEKLSPIEKAAIVYTGDLYHIRKHNPGFIRDLIDDMSRKVTGECSDALDRIKTIDEAILNLAHQICFDEVKGLGKDYARMHDLQRGIVETLVLTSEHILESIEHYQLFYEGFFLTLNLPPVISCIPNMIRRTVVLSDTDSTCFSTDEWIHWRLGEIRIDAQAFAIAGVVSFIATQCIAHALAIFSANMGVDRSNLFTLEMKNEFLWSVHLTTPVAKHYCARTIMQEGNVFKEPELEVKGVHLKNSALPAEINKWANDMMLDILSTAESNRKISIIKLLKQIMQYERMITESVLNGDLTFYMQSKIKDPKAYSRNDLESPYQHHLLWKQVFEAKYGVIQEPPYSVVKVSTTLTTPTALKTWLTEISDTELQMRMAQWLNRHRKTTLPTMYLPTQYLVAYGMIPEIKPIIDIQHIVTNLCNVFYMLLESLGWFKKPDLTLTQQLGNLQP